MKQRELSICLKVVDAIVVLGCIALLVYMIPIFASRVNTSGPQGFSPFVAFPTASLALMVVACVPVVVMGALAWRIFARIGNGNSFCTENASALRRFGLVAFIEGLYFAALGVVCLVAGVYSLGLLALIIVIIAICLVFGLVGVALSHLTLKAAIIQDENDLTV